MTRGLKKLPLDERIRLVEDLWDSIAAEQSVLPLSAEQLAGGRATQHLGPA